MKKFIFVLILFIRFSAFASNSDSLTTLVDLEHKITQKVKAIIEPVDPNAIVVAKVEIKKTTAHMPGTQLQAIELFATGDVQKIEETDIDEITVTIRSSMDPFPKEISKVIEDTILGISKKGRVSFLKMDNETLKAIEKQKDYQKSQKESVQKIVEFVGAITEKFGSGIFLFAFGYALMHLFLTGLSLYFHSRAANRVSKNISSIKFTGTSEDSGRAMMMPTDMGANQRNSARQEIQVNNQENPFEQMRSASLRALFSDAYWCENDNYASWMWSTLSTNKKIELLDSWAPFRDYVSFLNTIEPAQDRFHLDPTYLKPGHFHLVSNPDLVEALRKNKSIWGALSSLRRKSLPLTLKERVEFQNQKIKLAPSGIDQEAMLAVQSAPRVLPLQLDISSLNENDEITLMGEPALVSKEMRRQLPTLVWVALLPRQEREVYLEKVPAQSLAEAWVGPEATLKLIREVLPEKKAELLNEYVKKGIPSRKSPMLRLISNGALDLLEAAEASSTEKPAKPKAA